ncbi:MAG: hypothetical protein ACYC0C_02150 [Devosia sp.]
MALLDLGHSDAKPAALARNGADGEVHRTQYMLVITAIGSVSIIVVAALFMSLF